MQESPIFTRGYDLLLWGTVSSMERRPTREILRPNGL